MKLLTYILGQGESIESLANVLLGSYTKADTLIQINNLRYPYISDDPKDQLANPKGSALLTGSYTNPSVITINNVNSINILPNDSILLSEGASVGSGVVLSVSGSSITFTAPIVGSYDAAAMVIIFSNQQNVTTQILRTGDTLLYPFSLTDSTVGSNTNFSLTLGTDLALDSNGFLTRANNDIAVVSGLNNLFQAFRQRFQTRIGSLNMHDTYGNSLFDILGESSSAYFSGLAKHYAVECVLQDPRISRADVTGFIVMGDQFLFDLSVIPTGSQDPVVQPIAINIRGGGA